MVVDESNDGLGDSLDLTVKVVGMEAMRVVEAIAHRLAEEERKQAAAAEDRARDYRTQYEARAALARRELAPVMRDEWWAKAGVEDVRNKYVTALAFAQHDQRFAPYRERMEERAKALHDLEPDAILRGPVTKEPKVMGPLEVDDARLLAATQAPGWYRLQDQVTTDLAPALRERTEARLVQDMTQLRDTGTLDTDSARMEWGRFTGHPMATAAQDENESLADFETRRREALAKHWVATEADRESVSAPHGERVGKPMSVAEAEEFMDSYAPDWLVDRHRAVMAEAAGQEDPERAQWEQTSHREQLRYAMETARDTGGLGHPYAQALRSQAAMLGMDEEEGMHHVPPHERVRYGGPAARPMSEAEAVEVMDGWAPSWYQDQVRRTLREGTMLGDAARRIELDAVRADMTELRDRGVLSSDHAQRLWAVSQPGYDPEDMGTWKGVERRAQLWAETAGTREGPRLMDPNNRQRFGGTPDLDAEPRPVVSPQEWARRTVGARDRAEATSAPVTAPVPTQEPAPRRGREDPEAPVQDWPTATPGGRTEAMEEEVPGGRRRRPGAAYDTPERRHADARTARASGLTEEAVDSRIGVDYGRPTPPGTRPGGKPANFQQMVADATMAAQRARTRGNENER